jgi:4-amino-4-deoxy-L-arabinose transferase-like glycosyltransferase
MKTQFRDIPATLITLVVLGIALRAAFVLMADGKSLTFHSGGSDAPAYVLLAENLRDHRGYSYADQPSAFRPPGYPLLIVGFMSIFGSHYVFALRSVQFILGIVTVLLCSATASQLFGKKEAQATLVVGLFLPTLIFTTAQVLTECIAAFLTALFLKCLVTQFERSDNKSAWGLGLTAGFESLIRSNAAVLPLFAGCAALRAVPGRSRLYRIALVLLVPVLIVAPWFVRNEVSFRGRVFYSTQTGANAVQGVVTPQGRTQPGDSEKLIAAMGWCISQLERNDASRLSLPSEVELNAHALRVVPAIWRQQGWRAVLLLVEKIAAFWFSTDQLLDTGSFAMSDRLVRSGGVCAYWAGLMLAVLGWFSLRRSRRQIAQLLLLYAVGFTILHLPLVMSTRIRIPLMEPLVVILAGAGWLWVVRKMRRTPVKRSYSLDSLNRTTDNDVISVF